MVSPTIIGIAVVSIISTIATYFIFRPKNKSVENAGEVINNMKVIIPENNEIKYILYAILAFIIVYIAIKIFKNCTIKSKKNTKSSRKNTLSEMELANLDNPTYE